MILLLKAIFDPLRIDGPPLEILPSLRERQSWLRGSEIWSLDKRSHLLTCSPNLSWSDDERSLLRTLSLMRPRKILNAPNHDFGAEFHCWDGFIFATGPDLVTRWTRCWVKLKEASIWPQNSSSLQMSIFACLSKSNPCLLHFLGLLVRLYEFRPRLFFMCLLTVSLDTGYPFLVRRFANFLVLRPFFQQPSRSLALKLREFWSVDMTLTCLKGSCSS